MGVFASEHHVSRSRFAEVAGEGDVLPVVEVLAAEEDHLPLKQRGADPGHRLGGEGAGQVDALDLGPDVHGQRTNADGRGIGKSLDRAHGRIRDAAGARRRVCRIT